MFIYKVQCNTLRSLASTMALHIMEMNWNVVLCLCVVTSLCSMVQVNGLAISLQ